MVLLARNGPRSREGKIRGCIDIQIIQIISTALDGNLKDRALERGAKPAFSRVQAS